MNEEEGNPRPSPFGEEDYVRRMIETGMRTAEEMSQKLAEERELKRMLGPPRPGMYKPPPLWLRILDRAVPSAVVLQTLALLAIAIRLWLWQ